MTDMEQPEENVHHSTDITRPNPADQPARIRMAAGAESLSEMGEDPF